MTTASEIGYPCQACGRRYVTDMLVPDDVWEVIKPEGKDIGAGLLCPTCIMDRASDRLGWTVGFVYPERHGDAVTAGKAAPTSEVVARLLTPHTLDIRDIVQVRKLLDLVAVERSEAATLISSLVTEREQQPPFDGLPKRKLDDLLARGWEISGYAIHKDGEHGLVTTGGFVGWFTTAATNASEAERLLAEARAEVVAEQYRHGETGLAKEEAAEHLAGIIRAYDANSGAEPSVSVLARAIDEARASTGGVNG